jgi:hypothetical protein
MRDTPHEVHAYEVHAYEVHAHEVHTYEIHAREIHAYEIYIHEIHAHETHTLQIPILQTVVHLSYRKLRNREIEKCANRRMGHYPRPGHAHNPIKLRPLSFRSRIEDNPVGDGDGESG